MNDLKGKGRLFPARLLPDTVEKFLTQRIRRLPVYCDATLFSGMFELSVTSLLIMKTPVVFAQKPEDIFDFEFLHVPCRLTYLNVVIILHFAKKLKSFFSKKYRLG